MILVVILLTRPESVLQEDSCLPFLYPLGKYFEHQSNTTGNVSICQEIFLSLFVNFTVLLHFLPILTFTYIDFAP